MDLLLLVRNRRVFFCLVFTIFEVASQVTASILHKSWKIWTPARVHRNSITGSTEMVCINPLMVNFEASSIVYLFFIRTMLSSSDVLTLSLILSLIRSSYAICFKIDGDVPILSLFPATKTSLSLAFTFFAYSTDAEFYPLALSNTLSCPLVSPLF